MLRMVWICQVHGHVTRFYGLAMFEGSVRIIALAVLHENCAQHYSIPLGFHVRFDTRASKLGGRLICLTWFSFDLQERS
jgi:hypothetical protein